jgi:twitching motility protein PilT
MKPDRKDFDAFVEKLIIQHKLVSSEKIEQAKELQSRKPGVSLLDILVKADLLERKHAETLLARYRSISNQLQAAVQESGITAKPKDTRPAESNTLLSGGNNTRYQEPVQDSKQKVIRGPDVRQMGQNPLLSAQADEKGASQSSARVGSKPLEQLLNKARTAGASDLIINANSPPIIRKNGRLALLDGQAFSPEDTERLLFGILSEEQRQILKETFSLDICHDMKDAGRNRCCFVKQREGWGGSFRIIRDVIPTFQELGLPMQLQRLTEYQQGLVLVTGPAGMGKSTTLAAMVEQVNQSREAHIITLEDPIEYVFKPARSQISQRQVGVHTQSFSAALRAALREDPDVIMIGELRDRETASLTITAAETGHLVFASLHTNTASQTILRLLDFFPPDQQQQVRMMISESIRGIACQKLIPKKTGDGRVLALEILFNIPAVGNLIREDKLFQLNNTMRLNQATGMLLMEESVRHLLQKGLIDPTEANYAVIDQILFQGQSGTLKNL